MYGTKWTKHHGESDTGNVWYATLRDLTPEQLLIGLGKCANCGNEWPPSAPEFKAMCKQNSDVPSAYDAYLECCKKYKSPSMKPWSHPIVYHAGKKTGWFNLGTSTEDKVLPKFTKVYQSLIDRLNKGEVFSSPDHEKNRLEKHEHGKRVKSEENKETGAKALQGLREMLK